MGVSPELSLKYVGELADPVFDDITVCRRNDILYGSAHCPSLGVKAGTEQFR